MFDPDSDLEYAQRNSDSTPASNTDSQASDLASSETVRVTEEHPAAAISMNALLALMQTIKMASAGPKTEMVMGSCHAF